MYRSIQYFSDTLGVLEDPHIRNIGVCSIYFCAYNFPTGTTSTAFTSCSDSLLFMHAPSKSNPCTFLNAKKFPMPNFAPSQGQIIPVIIHCGFHTGTSHSKALHQRKPFRCEIIITNPFSSIPSMDAVFRCSK